jgi:hypothetical protein
MDHRRLHGADGEHGHCVEHTRADGGTELVVWPAGAAEALRWWPCAPGASWRVTADDVRARLTDEPRGRASRC